LAKTGRIFPDPPLYSPEKELCLSSGILWPWVKQPDCAILMQNPAPLTGYRFLIVEDEIMQAAHLGEMLAEMGGDVGAIAHGYDQARSALDRGSFDCAILDINLGGTLSFPIADILRGRGIPFVICTAYGEAVNVYSGVRGAPRIDKPVTADGLETAVLSALKQPVHG
jgi:DNA-binding NtrC family response regulator